MNDKPRTPDKAPAPDRDFQRRLAAKQRRRLHSQRQGEQTAWFGLGMFGLVGWSVAIPTVLCIALGLWLDRTVTGRYSWTLMLLGVGITLGCLNAWYWVGNERRAIERERRDPEEKDDAL